MKTKFILLVIVALIGVSTSSCKKKGCTDSLAENYESKAKKDDGSCTYARTKFIGSYTVNQDCEGDIGNYTLSITEGPNKNEVMLNNLQIDGYTVNIRATVSGGNISFNEEQQELRFYGDGYLNGNAITIDYNVCEEYYYPCSDPYSCTLLGSK